MPKYVYRYFPVKGLGEAPRMLFAYANQEFEDVRIDDEHWPEYKPHTPFGQMPVLEIDGKLYSQSVAIARYLGRKYGLAGETPEDRLGIDQIVDYVNDIRTKAGMVQYEEDPHVKENRHKDFVTNVYPPMLAKLDNIIAKNDGHLALKKLTWADFVLAGMMDYLKVMMRTPDLEEKYPNMKKVVDNVVTIPQVKAYIERAPKTEY